MIRPDLLATGTVIPLHRGVATLDRVHRPSPPVTLLPPDLDLDPDPDHGFARGIMVGLAIVLPVYALAGVAVWWWWPVVAGVLRGVGV